MPASHPLHLYLRTHGRCKGVHYDLSHAARPEKRSPLYGFIKSSTTLIFRAGHLVCPVQFSLFFALRQSSSTCKGSCDKGLNQRQKSGSVVSVFLTYSVSGYIIDTQEYSGGFFGKQMQESL